MIIFNCVGNWELGITSSPSFNLQHFSILLNSTFSICENCFNGIGDKYHLNDFSRALQSKGRVKERWRQKKIVRKV